MAGRRPTSRSGAPQAFEEIDRSEASRALAKAIALKACGKDDEARQWAAHLVDQLQRAGILDGA